MIKKWLSWINIAIAGLAIFLLLVAIWVLFLRPASIPVLDTAAVKTALPKPAFAQPKESYEAIKEPVLSLKFAPMAMQLPDLRKVLIYYGKNGRPDASTDNPMMHFAFTGNKTPTSLPTNEKIYLLFDKKQTPPQYIFSPGNAETPLWIEVSPQGNQALVKVGLKNEKGEVVQEPQSYAQFTLPEKEFVRFGGTPWEIGKLRVDGTLLARQRARWYGLDRFIEKHGGKEYQHLVNKQRIDFGEAEDTYSIYLGPGDVMIWENNKWKVVEPGDKSLGKPLLLVKKIDERLMNFELWDPDGKSKIALNLLKSNEPLMPPNLIQNFKFVGARTRSQFVFEINKERMLLSPQDWLILTDKGWVKLTTPEEIDAYVDRKLTGPMFVFDGVERREDRQYLIGTLFNTSRTDAQHIEILLQQNNTPQPSGNKADENSKLKRDKRNNSKGGNKTSRENGMNSQSDSIPETRDGTVPSNEED